MAKERGLTYVKLDGDIGILGNGAGLVMSTLDVVAQAGGKPANFLDAGGGSKAEAITQRRRGDPLRRQGQGRAVQHLRRHHPLRRGRQGPDRGVRRRSKPDGAVRRAPRRHQRRGGPRSCWPTRTCPTCTRSRRCSAPPQKVVELARRARAVMSILVDTDTRLCVSGITGREGTFHTLRNRDYGTQVVAGVTPGKGGQDVEGIPVFNTFHEAVERDRRQHRDDLRAAAVRRRLDPRGRGRGHRADHRITEGIPAHDELRVYNIAQEERPRAPARPQLPGHPLAGQGERRHHPGGVLQAGQRRRRLALGHADLPDRQRAGPERLRQLDDRRHRRRPGPRHRLHRRDRAVRGRPGDRADRDVRRDRRRRRGAGRRVHRRARLQAGRRLHRRLHRAARQDDGPRRRDRLGLAGHRRGEGARRSRPRACASGARRPRSPSSPSRCSAPPRNRCDPRRSARVAGALGGAHLS